MIKKQNKSAIVVLFFVAMSFISESASAVFYSQGILNDGKQSVDLFKADLFKVKKMISARSETKKFSTQEENKILSEFNWKTHPHLISLIQSLGNPKDQPEALLCTTDLLAKMIITILESQPTHKVKLKATVDHFISKNSFNSEAEIRARFENLLDQLRKHAQKPGRRDRKRNHRDGQPLVHFWTDESLDPELTAAALKEETPKPKKRFKPVDPSFWTRWVAAPFAEQAPEELENEELGAEETADGSYHKELGTSEEGAHAYEDGVSTGDSASGSDAESVAGSFFALQPGLQDDNRSAASDTSGVLLMPVQDAASVATTLIYEGSDAEENLAADEDQAEEESYEGASAIENSWDAYFLDLEQKALRGLKQRAKAADRRYQNRKK
jgi:hypothetical protein